MSIELAWLLLAGSGLAVSLYALSDAQRSVRAIHNRYNGRRVVARGYRRSEFLTTIKQLILLLAGVPSAIEPRPVQPSWIVGVLFAIVLLSIARTVLELRDRHVLRSSADQAEAQ